ncbi:MAG: tetratricopeptide repeat protein [Deinococcales bacterium]
MNFKVLLAIISLTGLLWSFAQDTQDAQGQSPASQESADLANYLTAIRESMAKAEAAYAGSHFSVDQPLWRETLNYLDQALAAKPGDRQVLVFAIEIYEKLGWHSRSWYYGQLFLAAGYQVNARVLAPLTVAGNALGYAFYEQGEKAQALDYYQTVYQLDPENDQALLWLARIYSEVGAEDKALPLWELAASKDLEGAEYYLNLSQKSLEYNQAAVSAFEEGLALYKAGDLLKARESFSKAIEAAKEFTEAWAWLGRVNLELGSSPPAIQAWQQVLKLDPNYEGASYFLALSEEQGLWGIEASNNFQAGLKHYQEGRIKEAALAFEQAVEANSFFLDAIKWTARSYQELGNKDKALRFWQRAAELAPQDESVRYFLAELRQKPKPAPAPSPQVAAQAEPQVQREPQALAADNIMSYDEALEAYKAQDWAKAEAGFRGVLEHSPQHSGALIWLGRLYFDQKDYAKAIDIYQAALKLKPGNQDLEYFLRESKRLCSCD